MRPKILLIDDDPYVTAGLQRTLRKEPYDILTAHSADEALQFLSRDRVDVIVSDEKMPGMSGSELLAQVHLDYPDTVRILLTGQASMEAALRAINEAEVYRFLLKPCDEAALARTIELGLERKERSADSHSQPPTKHRALVVQELERENPGIVRVNRDADGTIVLDEAGTGPGNVDANDQDRNRNCKG